MVGEKPVRILYKELEFQPTKPNKSWLAIPAPVLKWYRAAKLTKMISYVGPSTNGNIHVKLQNGTDMWWKLDGDHYLLSHTGSDTIKRNYNDIKAIKLSPKDLTELARIAANKILNPADLEARKNFTKKAPSE